MEITKLVKTFIRKVYLWQYSVYDSLTIRPQIVNSSVLYGMHSANQRSTNQLHAVRTCQQVGTYSFRNQ